VKEPAVSERVVTLVPEEAGGEPITFSIGTASKLVGRTVKEGVRIGDTRISRRHASFRVQGDAVLVCDEGSANGTWVNNQRVKEQAVKDGDIVRFGAAAFRVKLA